MSNNTTNKEKPGIGKKIVKTAANIFIPKKKPQTNLSKPGGIRKTKSIADLTQSTSKLKISSPDDTQMAPPVPQLPIPQLAVPHAKPTYRNSHRITLETRIGPQRRLLLECPLLKSQHLESQLPASCNSARLQHYATELRGTTVQNLDKIIEYCAENKRETADEVFNRLCGAARTAQEQDTDRREGTILNKQFFGYAIDASNDASNDTTTPKQSEMQDAPAVPAVPGMPNMCDLTNLIGFKISLLVRILKLTTSREMRAPRVFDACNVPILAALCISIQSGLHFNDFGRWPDKREFMFEDGREVTWEEGSREKLPEVYHQFLEGRKSQGERDVSVRNHAMSYQMNVEGKMVPEQADDIEVMGHVTLYYR